MVLDGNLRRDTFEAAVAGSVGARTIFEPVSVPKATGLSDLLDHRIYAVTPNEHESAVLTSRPVATAAEVNSSWRGRHTYQRGIELVWVRLGEQGSVLSTATDVIEIPAVGTESSRRDWGRRLDAGCVRPCSPQRRRPGYRRCPLCSCGGRADHRRSARRFAPNPTPRLVESALAAASPTPSTTSQGIL